MENKNNKDWIIIDSFDVTLIEKNIKNKIKNLSPISLDTKSTKGERSKQYMLFDHIKDDPILNTLKEKILKNLNDIDIHGTLNLKSAWTVLGYKGSYHTVHKHNDRLNHISTILYLNVPKIEFKQDGNFYFFINNDNQITFHSYKPKRGNLIIMPVWIYHGTYPQQKGLRQSLNLDFEII